MLRSLLCGLAAVLLGLACANKPIPDPIRAEWEPNLPDPDPFLDAHAFCSESVAEWMPARVSGARGVSSRQESKLRRDWRLRGERFYESCMRSSGWERKEANVPK